MTSESKPKTVATATIETVFFVEPPFEWHPEDGGLWLVASHVDVPWEFLSELDDLTEEKPGTATCDFCGVPIGVRNADILTGWIPMGLTRVGGEDAPIARECVVCAPVYEVKK